MKLILFDIDGTLLLSDGAGRRAMEGALTDVFGSPGSSAYRYDGKTDRQIVRELMRQEGHADDHIDGRMDRLLDGYLARLEVAIEDIECRVHRYDGVLELLDLLDTRDDLIVGLLTGNLERGAAVKLAAAGIDPGRFSVSAFGSDHEVRRELPGIAQRRARERHGVDLPGESVIVVGDTPSDIDCCRPIGARAVGVATGRYTVDELLEHNPHAVLPDLRDAGAFFRAIDDA